MSQEPICYNIKQLFEADDKYFIPIYQRNYSWQQGEVKQLIQDVFDSYVNTPDSPYYIGTLVAYERKEDGGVHYETIDGQQRLTTLTILLHAIHRWSFEELSFSKIKLAAELRFSNRQKSANTIDVIKRGHSKQAEFINNHEYDTNIKNRYADAEAIVKQMFGYPNQIAGFYNYLVEKVQILRVLVPEKTDLNHYFEIMNNRGEQLEKHEVLKANLLNHFTDSPQKLSVFNKIWEAVSDMESYVQYGFDKVERSLIFGGQIDEEKWNNFQCSNFTDIMRCLTFKEEKDDLKGNVKMTIDEILNSRNAGKLIEGKQDEGSERFNSVVNFPGFLLHVLRIQKGENIPLDDKRILEVFNNHLETQEDVETFGYNLLKLRHLFDQYIIKREFKNEKEKWSLLKVKCYQDQKTSKISYVNSIGENGGREVIMLLSMFHVSLPSMNYKHWLNAALKHLFEKPVNDLEYENFLFDLARSYFFDRILAPANKEKDYFAMIYRNEYQNRSFAFGDLCWSNLNKGTAVENFAFNFVDYIIWKSRNNLDSREAGFEFSSRSSVEHYYPQNPINGVPLDDKEALDNFGNLCLISSSKNSRLSNYMPIAKKDHYSADNTIESLKQYRMMKMTSETSPWDSSSIYSHAIEIRQMLEKYY